MPDPCPKRSGGRVYAGPEIASVESRDFDRETTEVGTRQNAIHNVTEIDTSSDRATTDNNPSFNRGKMASETRPKLARVSTGY